MLARANNASPYGSLPSEASLRVATVLSDSAGLATGVSGGRYALSLSSIRRASK